MAMRLQELHPAIVHYPITLLPTTLVADALGRFTRSRTLLEIGRKGMALTAGSAVISAVAGLLAQESSRFDAETHDILVTHRNLNLALIGLTGAMAVQRAKRRRPSLGYLLTGFAGVGVMAYSAYLGGHMVYEHGVGVAEAGGLRQDQAPRLVPENIDEVLQISAQHVVDGLRDVVEHLARGEIVPWLTRGDDRPEPRTEPAAELPSGA